MVSFGRKLRSGFAKFGRATLKIGKGLGKAVWDHRTEIAQTAGTFAGASFKAAL